MPQGFGEPCQCLTRLKLRNFKSWQDTGDLVLRPITGLFGANSSGKTSLLQALLLLKQTANSPDRGLVFHFGGSSTQIDLGDFRSVVHEHDTNEEIEASHQLGCRQATESSRR